MTEIEKPLRFAHRGLTQYAPENTLGAFKAAIEHGCEGIELDVHMSKDNVPVVVHDNALFRLSDGAVSAWVNDLTVKELKETDLPYAGHLLPFNPPSPYPDDEGSVAHYKADEIKKMRAEDKRVAHMMTFEEFDKWFEAENPDVTVEIEICEGGLAESVYEIVSKSANISKYILFSSSMSTNEEIQEVVRRRGKPLGLRLGANIKWLNDETEKFVNSSDLYEVGLNDGKFTREDVEKLRKKGIVVFSNLGDYPEWWEEMQTLGIYAFKTNYAEAYAEWLEKRESTK